MKLSNEELKKIYFGAYEFEETADGYLKANQYTKEQMKYFEGAMDMWFERCDASTSKTLEFVTKATEVSFDYKIIWEGSQDSIEVAVDNIIFDIKYVKDLEKEGKITFKLPANMDNPDSDDVEEKLITIYLPADATALIKNFEIDADYTPAKKGEKVLWLGDSITQGFGPLRSAMTYVSVANRLLNYDILNQGIGGYVYDKKSLIKMEGYKPDKIIVAMGTNQYGDESMSPIEEYYDTLTGIYGKDIPILCITPLWRGDTPEGIPTLISFNEKLRKIVEKYDNVMIVDGFKLVPHLSEYFLDNLHPNGLGMETYGRNLVEEIRRLGF